jgi:DNA mismatch repair ATPase MutS
MRDLSSVQQAKPIIEFTQALRKRREYIDEQKKRSNPYQKQSLILDAVDLYCQAVAELASSLPSCHFHSEGMNAFQHYLLNYVESNAFQSLLKEIQQLRKELSKIIYSVKIRGTMIRVQLFDDEIDYGAVVSDCFAKFKESDKKEYKWKTNDSRRMNDVESKIIECVAKLNPQTFQRLANFCESAAQHMPDPLVRFEREIEFYLAYLQYIAPLQSAGLTFCYPDLVEESDNIEIQSSFDLVLAVQLQRDHATIVPNDMILHKPERIVIVSGPNQGGKTTFARSMGQVFFLASLGCPIPGITARIFLADQVLTHFEKVEDTLLQRGKLHDDLLRIHTILKQVTTKSVIVINEIFNATTLQDALFLGRQVIREISLKKALCVCVTFVDELSTFNAQTVSMVSTVDPVNSDLRTFKVVRQQSNGLSFAMTLARKHGLTYRQLKGLDDA